MPKKTQKYCSIHRFLEDNDKELHEVFERLCIGTLLRPKGKANGVTFLYPKDADYRKEIISAAYGANPEKALQMLRAITLLDYLPQTSDFVTRKDDLPNALLQRVGVTSADSKTVKLSSGLELTKDSKFVPMDGRKLCVYKMSGKGKRIPLDGKPTEWTHSERNQKPKKTGGVQQIQRGTIKDLLRADITDAATKPQENPFAERCMSYLRYACLDKGNAPSEALAKCLKPIPEMTYLALLAHWEVNYQEFHGWLAKTKGMYACDKAQHKDNVHLEYLSVYDKVVELYYKDKDYGAMQAARRQARATAAESLGAHSTVSKLRQAGAVSLWCDELPVVTMIPVLRLLGYEKKGNTQAAAAIMKELHCTVVVTRPKSSDDFEGTYSGRAFKGDVALYLSAALALVRSNAYQYQPLTQGDAAGNTDGDTTACFVDADGSVDESAFNLMGKLFNAQKSRPARACFLGHLA